MTSIFLIQGLFIYFYVYIFFRAVTLIWRALNIINQYIYLKKIRKCKWQYAEYIACYCNYLGLLESKISNRWLIFPLFNLCTSSCLLLPPHITVSIWIFGFVRTPKCNFIGFCNIPVHYHFSYANFYILCEIVNYAWKKFLLKWN